MIKEQKEGEKWLKTRTKLRTSYEVNPSWVEAIDLYQNRIQSKFMSPIRYLIELNHSAGEGFTILSTQCLLIESFAAFREGKIYVPPGRKVENPAKEYNRSGELFVKFLQSASIFEGTFFKLDAKGNPTTDAPFSAANFYSQVRCGLLHEAKTKGNWKINTKKNSKPNDPFIENKNGSLIIYRTILQNRLETYLDNYANELRSEENGELRKCFARKLDDLFDVPIDKDYDWWK